MRRLRAGPWGLAGRPRGEERRLHHPARFRPALHRGGERARLLGQLAAGAERVLAPGDGPTVDATQMVHTPVNHGGPAVIWQAHDCTLGEAPTTVLGTPAP